MFTLVFDKQHFHIPQNINEREYADVLRVSNGGVEGACLDLTTIECFFDEKVVRVSTAIGNNLPLFWAWNGQQLVVSDSVAAVVELIQSGEKGVGELDKVGIIESILFDGPLKDRTLYERIKKFQMAEIVDFNLNEKILSRSWRWLPKIQVHQKANDSKFEEQARHHISSLDVHFHSDVSNIVLPITGGFDSRLLATLCGNKKAISMHSYTFQRGWSLESWCAKKVAGELGSEHFIFNLDERCYRDLARSVVKNSGGLVTGMHTHGIYCCEKLLRPQLRLQPRVFGYFGDPVTGAMTELESEGAVVSTAEHIFDKYSRSMFSNVVQQYKEEIVADLQSTYDAFTLSGSPAHCFHEFWKIHQRQNNLITHLFGYHRTFHSVEVNTPFINIDFIEFFLGLPLEQRFNRSLFKKVSRELYPKIFTLPSMHFSNGSLLSKMESTFEMLESFANKLSVKQELLLSPFKYEQHEKNLINYLDADVKKGAEVFCDLFKCESKSIQYPTWKNQSTPKEYYRLAALGYLAEQ